MKKFSYLMAIGLIVALFAMSMNLNAETVTIVSNSNSGIENATHTATFSDGTVLGFYDLRSSGVYFCGAISEKTSLTVPDSVIIYSASSTNRYPVKYIGYNRLDFNNAQSISSLTLPSLVSSLNCMASTVKVLHTNSYISSVTSSCLSNLAKVLVPESTLSSYLGNSSWRDYVLINAEGTNPLSITINMTKPGEFAQLLLEQTDNNWNAVNELTVTGELNSDDLLILHKLRQLTKLDLSNAIIDAIPDYNNDNGSGILETVLLPKINFIGSYAFQYCRRLRSISLPSGITTIGSYAFQYSGLRNVEIPNTLKTIGSFAFHECSALASVTIPSSVTTIGSHAFSYCTRLNSVSFAEGLNTLGSHSFCGCTALKEIDLPSTLIYLYSGAFSSCKGINKVVCRAVTPPTQYNNSSTPDFFLNGCDLTNVKLFVPALSIDSYRAQFGWKSFYTILSLEEKLTYAHFYDKATIDDGSQFDDNCTVKLGWSTQYRNGVSATYRGAVDYNDISTFTMQNYRQWHYMGTADNSNPYAYGAIHTSLIANGAMSAEDVKTSLRIPSSKYWYFISLPYDVKVSDIIYPDGVKFVIRKYSGFNRANQSTKTWLNLTEDSIMHAYEGYILKCNTNDYADFTFPAINNSNKNRVFEKDNAIVPLKEYLSEFDHNRSWNLIGNPYPCYYDTRFMDFTAPIIVWNRNNSRYDAYSPIDDSFILTPAQAFFVQCPINKSSITFDKDGRQKNADVRTINSMGKRIAANRQLYNIVLTSGKTEDHTRFVFNDAASRSYELDKDASKLIASDNTSMLVYTLEDGVRYAINERDYADGIVHLGFYAPQDGLYCLSLESNATMDATLIDHDNNIQSSMMDGYAFHAKAGFNDARFTIVFGTSGIIELNNDNVMIDVRNGVVSSNVRCKIYTIDGREIGTCEANGSINLDKGIYVIYGNNVTRKIIVK